MLTGRLNRTAGLKIEETETFFDKNKILEINRKQDRLLDYNLQGVEKEEVDVFWLKIRDADDNNKPLFKNVSDLFLNILRLLLSIASVKRLWSKWQNEKPQLRNKLNFTLMKSLLLASY